MRKKGKSTQFTFKFVETRLEYSNEEDKKKHVNYADRELEQPRSAD